MTVPFWHNRKRIILSDLVLCFICLLERNSADPLPYSVLYFLFNIRSLFIGGSPLFSFREASFPVLLSGCNSSLEAQCMQKTWGRKEQKPEKFQAHRDVILFPFPTSPDTHHFSPVLEENIAIYFVEIVHMPLFRDDL